MSSPFIRSPYNYDVEAASLAAAIPVEANGESLTIQSMSEDADINVLMRRFGITGTMPSSVRVPEYGDFSGISDFQSALDAVQAGWDNFNAMPADVRARFENSPQRFLEFCAVEANLPELRKMGLAIPEKVGTVTPVVDPVVKPPG